MKLANSRVFVFAANAGAQEVTRDGLRDTMACHDRRIQWPYAGDNAGCAAVGPLVWA